MRGRVEVGWEGGHEGKRVELGGRDGHEGKRGNWDWRRKCEREKNLQRKERENVEKIKKTKKMDSD